MKILHLSPYVPDVRASHAGGVLMGKEVETLKQLHPVHVLTFCNNQREEELRGIIRILGLSGLHR